MTAKFKLFILQRENNTCFSICLLNRCLRCLYTDLERKHSAMDIEQALRDEHSKTQTLKIVKFIGNDKTRFKKLVDIFLNGEYRVTQRAAWPLSNVALDHPELIKPYFSKLINLLGKPENHPAIDRNILRIFQDIDIPEKHHGNLVDASFKFMMDVKYPAGIRAFAISVAANICKNYPELKRELILILEEFKKYPQQPAISSRLKQAFRTLSVGG